jgi:hypothetical protein
MSLSAAQAQAFFDELDGTCVWTIEDDGGVPAPKGETGHRVMPFWSRESRARKIVGNVPAYAGFRSRRIPLDEWVERWLPGMARDGLRVGLNWYGSHATGYDFTPGQVLKRLAAHRADHDEPAGQAEKLDSRKGG